jgi:hypothetical protein
LSRQIIKDGFAWHGRSRTASSFTLSSTSPVALTVDGLGNVFTAEVRVIAAIKNRWCLFCIKGRRMQFYRTRASSSPAAAAVHDAAIACTPSHCFRLSWNCTTNLWRLLCVEQHRVPGPKQWRSGRSSIVHINIDTFMNEVTRNVGAIEHCVPSMA